jgi:hypothetical protein
MSVVKVTRRLHYCSRWANEQVLRDDGMSTADLATTKEGYGA